MVIFTQLGWQSQWHSVRAGLRNIKKLSRKGA